MKIAVIGDVMLDVYIEADPRDNGENADVCVTGKFWNYRLGGAGNVLKILSREGVEVDFYGAVGPDFAGPIIVDLASVDLPVARTATTVKIRAVKDAGILARIDCDGEMIGPPPIPSPEALNSVNAVIFSDYNKGMFGRGAERMVRDIVRRVSVPIIVDPHPSTPSSMWRGTLVATPNMKEYREMNEEVGSLFAAVTDGGRGAVLYGKGVSLGRFSCPDPVADPQRVGAGDAFVSKLAMNLAAGDDVFSSTMKAVEFSNEYVKIPRH